MDKSTALREKIKRYMVLHGQPPHPWARAIFPENSLSKPGYRLVGNKVQLYR